MITSLYEIRCIICNEGYVASIRYGNCYPQELNLESDMYKDAKILIEGESQVDAQIQKIKSFMMKFLPNQYIYQRPYQNYFCKSKEIECQNRYQLFNQYQCTKYCTSEFLGCQESKSRSYFQLCKMPNKFLLITYQQMVHALNFLNYVKQEKTKSKNQIHTLKQQILTNVFLQIFETSFEQKCYY